MSLSAPPCSDTVPDTSVDILSNDLPVLGEEYQLTCAVTIEYSTEINIAYTLSHENLDRVASDPVSVMFDAIGLEDAGIYQCSAEITSPYFNNITLSTEHTITFSSE